MTVKLAILFYSTYGTNQTMAEIAAEAARAAGAEVRLLRIAETAPESVVNSQDGWKAQVSRRRLDPGCHARRHGMGERLPVLQPHPVRRRGKPGPGIHRHAGRTVVHRRAGEQGGLAP